MKRVVVPLLLVLVALGIAAAVMREPGRTGPDVIPGGERSGAGASADADPSPGSPEATYASAVEALERGDPAQAVERLRRAADRDHAGAAFRLGAIYEAGRGVERDPDRAVAWYRRAAAAGDQRAWLNLAHMYATGDGVPEDESKAAQWYERAAREGNAHAQYALGLTYDRGGTGLERDPVAAWFWLTVAAERFGANAFRDSANQARAEIENDMTAAQLERARRRLGRWRAAND